MKKIVLVVLSLFSFQFMYAAGETISITTPAANGDVNGINILFSGPSSVPNAVVAITINTVLVAKVLTDAGGNWNYTYPHLDNGNYTLEVKLINSAFETLASDTTMFTVINTYSVSILSPTENEQVETLADIITGSSNALGHFVRVVIDSVVTDTVSTSSVDGSWQASYPFLRNQSHTLTAQLLSQDLMSVLASDTEVFTSFNPILYEGVTEIRIIQGRVPTTGSGSGNGFTYNVVGSVITLTITTPFSQAPLVVATGERASGASTVTINSSSTTTVALEFSVSTEFVHFQLAGL